MLSKESKYMTKIEKFLERNLKINSDGNNKCL